MAGKKPKPSMLGTGAAAKAGKKLEGREAQIDAYVKSATTGKKKNTTKKKNTAKKKKKK